jgi:DNA-binding CsgD family transcriptional regulator
LDAAKAKVAAGAFEDASALLAWAVAGPLNPAERARVDLLRAQIAHHSHHGNEALPMLLSAARRLERIDSGIARATYLDALAAAMFAGRLARDPAVGMRQVAEAVRKLQLPPAPDKSDLHLRDIAVLYTEGYAAAAPGLRRTVDAFGTDDLTVDETVRCVWLAACAATDLWDDVNWDVVTRRHLDGIRQVGALSVLPLALNSRAIYLLLNGDLAEAESLVAETAWLAEITAGQNAMLPYGDVCLSAMRGDASLAEPQMNRVLDEIAMRGEGVGLNVVSWFQAMLYNGLGRFADAMSAAQVAAAAPLELGPPKWALGELIEAAVHSGSADAAASAFEQLSGFAQASGTELALGIEAGCKALLRSGPTAEGFYREAIERLERTTIRVELARTQLRFGEWLRREGRRADARGQLRKAYEALSAMGVGGFAERARKELVATGENVAKSSEARTADLTAQEAHIARLAAVGLTNQEIGAELYISARTVEWHLRKVFVKLGVNNRRQLRQSLSDFIEEAAG